MKLTRSSRTAVSVAVVAAAIGIPIGLQQSRLAAQSMNPPVFTTVSTLSGTGGPTQIPPNVNPGVFNRPCTVEAAGGDRLAVSTNNIGPGMLWGFEGASTTAATSTVSAVGPQSCATAVDSEGRTYIGSVSNVYLVSGGAGGTVGTLSAWAGSNAGTVDGPRATALFTGITALDFDVAGTLFVGQFNGVIRKIAADGTVTTYLGTPGVRSSVDGPRQQASANDICDIETDGQGNIFFSDQTDDVIRRIDAATGMVTTVAGAVGVRGFADGIGTSASFANPCGLALDDASGTLYVADFLNNAVRSVRLLTGEVATLTGRAGFGAEDGPLATAKFYGPRALALMDGALYVADLYNNRLRRIGVADPTPPTTTAPTTTAPTTTGPTTTTTPTTTTIPLPTTTVEPTTTTSPSTTSTTTSTSTTIVAPTTTTTPNGQPGGVFEFHILNLLSCEDDEVPDPVTCPNGGPDPADDESGGDYRIEVYDGSQNDPPRWSSPDIDYFGRMAGPGNKVACKDRFGGLTDNCSTDGWDTGDIRRDGGLSFPIVVTSFDGGRTATLRVRVYDNDDNNDDVIDVGTGAGTDGIITIDLATGNWSVDGELRRQYLRGTGGEKFPAIIGFDISKGGTPDDTDNDGLLNTWETDGIVTADVRKANPVKNFSVARVPLPGANPAKRDLYIEIDWLKERIPLFRDPNTSFIDVVQAFAAAPAQTAKIDRPASTPGITLHADAGVRGGSDGLKNLGGGNEITSDLLFCGVSGSSFRTTKKANFDPNRRWGFRYHLAVDGNHRAPSCPNGQGELPGNDSITLTLTENSVPIDGGLPADFMHEIGHNLGLQHGGNSEVNWKPNYFSVMNYSYAAGLRINGTQGAGSPVQRQLDFSPPRLFTVNARSRSLSPVLNEENLDERIPINPERTDLIAIYFPNNAKNWADLRGGSAAVGRYDFNNNKSFIDVGVQTVVRRATTASIIGPIPAIDRETALHDSNDWDRIKLKIGTEGPPGYLQTFEPDETGRPSVEQRREFEAALSTADLAALVDGSLTGSKVNFDLSVTNLTSNTALATTVSVSVVGGTPTAIPSECLLVSNSELLCKLGDLGGISSSAPVRVQVTPASGSRVVSVTATASFGAPGFSIDPNPVNNTAISSIAIPVPEIIASVQALSSFVVSGVSNKFTGQVISGGTAQVQGFGHQFGGGLRTGRAAVISGTSHTFTPSPTVDAPQLTPVDIAPWRPGGSIATAIGTSYRDMSTSCVGTGSARKWTVPSALAPGVYYASCRILFPTYAKSYSATFVSDTDVVIAAAKVSLTAFPPPNTGESSQGSRAAVVSGGTILLASAEVSVSGQLLATNDIAVAGARIQLSGGVKANRVTVSGVAVSIAS